MDFYIKRMKRWIRGLIKRNLVIGKMLARLMSYIEFIMLEILNFINNHISPHFMIRITNSVLNGRWGGKVVPLNINIPAETQYLPSNHSI